MKVHKYNTKKYNFGELLEGKYTLDDGYKVIRSKKFIKVWESFILNELTKILSSNKIVVQKLPSIRMHPNYTYLNILEVVKNSVKTTSQSWAQWSNMHKDSDAPYHHPKFDINFWMPLIDVSLENTMYVETSPNNYEPVLLKYGELLEFKGNTTNHGGKVYNSSEDFRTSLDFRGCTYDNYDESVLEDIPIFVTGKKDTTQKNWFVIDEYYSLYEKR